MAVRAGRDDPQGRREHQGTLSPDRPCRVLADAADRPSVSTRAAAFPFQLVMIDVLAVHCDICALSQPYKTRGIRIRMPRALGVARSHDSSAEGEAGPGGPVAPVSTGVAVIGECGAAAAEMLTPTFRRSEPRGVLIDSADARVADATSRRFHHLCLPHSST